MDAPQSVKRRKITDRTLPKSLEKDYADITLYNQLLEAERALDWNVTRKRVELQDSLTRTHTVKKVLRVTVSHSCLDQAWQTTSLDQDGSRTIDFEGGAGIPSWKLKVEGRLLDGPQRFASLVKAMAINVDRDPNVFPEGNHVEWHRQAGQTEQDGFEIVRRGDMTTQVQVILQVEQHPERYKLSPQLSSVLCIKEESRNAIVTALWNYVKINQLQDKGDRRMIKADDKLRMLSGVDNIHFQQIHDLIDRHLSPADPHIIPYTVVVEPASSSGSRSFDIEVELEDVQRRNLLSTAITKLSTQNASNLLSLDEEIAEGAQSIRNSRIRHEFFLSLSKDPRNFTQRWLSSQSRDLDLVLGHETGVREEDLKYSEFFKEPWVDNAVAVHEGLRVAGALQKLHEGR